MSVFLNPFTWEQDENKTKKEKKANLKNGRK